MTKRESLKVVKRRGRLHAIQAGLAQAQRLCFTKPADIAECVLEHLENHDEDVAEERRFQNHRTADPHCTCNDCVAYHAQPMR